MIFGIPALFFWLIMLLAFLFGAAGTLITMAIVRFAAQRKAKEKKNNFVSGKGFFCRIWAK